MILFRYSIDISPDIYLGISQTILHFSVNSSVILLMVSPRILSAFLHGIFSEFLPRFLLGFLPAFFWTFLQDSLRDSSCDSLRNCPRDFFKKLCWDSFSPGISYENLPEFPPTAHSVISHGISPGIIQNFSGQYFPAAPG